MKKELKIYLASPRGFCAGVKRAIEIVEKAINKYGTPVYVRHEIVHNKQVVDELREKGAIFVDELSDIKDSSRPVIFLLAIYFLNNFYMLDEAIYKVIFIGLASLTFPHILLEYLLEKNEKRT